MSIGSVTQMKLLDGKTAIVTGGGTGIGRAVALALARQGASVAVVNRSSIDAARAVATEIEQIGARSVAIQADVSSAQAIESVVQQTIAELGQIDILVNNAGINRDSLLVRMSDQDWDDVINTNLRGAFLLCRAAVKVMMKQRRGKIVNISSVFGIVGNAGQANYCASKFGLIGLTQSLAKEVGSRNIQVNAVAPGFIETAMTHSISDTIKEEWIKRVPAGRLGSVDDVAAAVAFLCGPGSDYITGHTLTVDGGMTI
jgi:3-oxoacyl-[acyl-carrier protein] reductase